MKVVLFTHNFPQFSETFIVRQFIYLLQKNVDAYVVAHKSKDLDLFPEVLKHKGRIRYIPNTYNNRVSAILKLPFLLLKTFLFSPTLTVKYFIKTIRQFGVIGAIKKFLSEYPVLYLKPHIIHFEFLPIAREHYHLKEILKAKIVASLRGYGITYSHIDQQDYYKQLFENLDGIHTISEFLINFAYKHRGLPPNTPYKIIPPAVDKKLLDIPRMYRNSDGFNDPVRILTVARLHWTKGYEYVLKALELLKNSGIRFEYHIVGDGPLREMILYLRDIFFLHREVKILGKLPFERVIEEYKWADIFVIGSITEGFCNAVLEAQALGLPQVVTDAPALMENIEKDVTALVAQRRNPHDIATKLKILITQPHKRKALGNAGRKRVAKNFLLDKQVEKFYEFYKTVGEFNNSMTELK